MLPTRQVYYCATVHYAPSQGSGQQASSTFQYLSLSWVLYKVQVSVPLQAWLSAMRVRVLVALARVQQASSQPAALVQVQAQVFPAQAQVREVLFVSPP